MKKCKKKEDEYPIIKGKNKVRRITYVKKEQKMSSVQISLGKVVKDERWQKMLRHLSKQMTKMRWVGTRVFNHFVLFAVITG